MQLNLAEQKQIWNIQSSSVPASTLNTPIVDLSATQTKVYQVSPTITPQATFNSDLQSQMMLLLTDSLQNY